MRGLLGLSVRAGQAMFGQGGCLTWIRSGACALLLLDSEASGNTMDLYRRACREHDVPLGILPCGLLEKATGRPGVAVALKAGGLTDQLLKLVDTVR